MKNFEYSKVFPSEGVKAGEFNPDEVETIKDA